MTWENNHHPPEATEEEEEKEEKPGYFSSSKLKKEFDSWRPFAQALRFEDRVIFNEMLNRVASSYAEAVESSGRGYDTEAVLMSTLLSQQKTIDWLTRVIEGLKEEKKDRD